MKLSLHTIDKKKHTRSPKQWLVPFKPVRVAVYILTLLTVSGAVIVSLFLYRNVYLGIEAAEKLNAAKMNVSDVSLNINLFEDVIQNLDKKITPEGSNLDELKNPFVDKSIPPPAATVEETIIE